MAFTQEQFAQFMQSYGGASSGHTSGSKSVKPDRPSIDIEATESEWAVFEDDWKRFKRMAHLSTLEEIRDNLRQCCSKSLNKRLFDLKGSTTLDAASEVDLTQWMKEISVKGVHKEVHRTQFVNIRQKQGESMNSYFGRLKAEAALCDYRVSAPTACPDVACTCAHHGIQVSYQDDMVSTQMVAGIYNTDHQSKVLAESANLASLDAKFQRLLVLEKSDTSLSTLSGGDAHVNYYGGGKRQFGSKKKNWRDDRKKEPAQRQAADGVCQDYKQKHNPCRSCGGFHKCTTKCNSCKGMGHIRNCCPSTAEAAVVVPDANDHGALDQEAEVMFSVSSDSVLAPVDMGMPVQITSSGIVTVDRS